MLVKTALGKIALVTALIFACWAFAIEPVNGDSFNVEANFDLAALTPDNFYDVVVPLAEEQGSLVFFDFTESFGPFFLDTVIPMFEAKYDIDVEHFSVDGNQAVQQMIAARNAGSSAPADVFFLPNGQALTATEGGITANLPLNTMLPSAPDLDQGAATVSRGYTHGGTIVPFHRNQTAIGYDTRFVSEDEVPRTFEALSAFAAAHRGEVAVTSPARGGSGSGFLESAILHFTREECQARLYDASLTEAEAEAWAASDCLDPVLGYFAELAPNVEITNGNSDTLTLIANGVAHVGTVWEDMGFDFIGRGLLPPTVRFLLLDDGQVGDGDGVMIPAGTEKLAAALLFVDFLLSDEVQLVKIERNGSRSARLGLDLSSALSEETQARLVPSDQYPANSRPRINNLITNKSRDRVVAEVLAQ
ncbi:MAG: extracellular solute-binding protein [Truepera sp.]|nr:extracellular solute-binding protein [Truepera sp.]